MITTYIKKLFVVFAEMQDSGRIYIGIGKSIHYKGGHIREEGELESREKNNLLMECEFINPLEAIQFQRKLKKLGRKELLKRLEKLKKTSDENRNNQK